PRPRADRGRPAVESAHGHHRRPSNPARTTRAGAKDRGNLAKLGQEKRPPMVEPIEALFPELRDSAFRVSSPATRDYNCIAWAATDTKHWWWPDIDPDNDTIFWPAGVGTEETLDAFLAAFA